jgi:hypothetical protein
MIYVLFVPLCGFTILNKFLPALNTPLPLAGVWLRNKTVRAIVAKPNQNSVVAL